MTHRTKIALMAALMLCLGALAEAQPGGYRRGMPRPYRKSAPTYRTPVHASPYGSSLVNITEFGYTFGLGEFDRSGRLSVHEANMLEVSQSLCLGVGVGFNYFTEAQLYNMPLYAMLRHRLPGGAMSLHTDWRIGYSLGSVQGLYFAPSVGVRLGYDGGVTLSVGYEMQRFSENDEYGYRRSYTVNGLSLRIGYEW